MRPRRIVRPPHPTMPAVEAVLAAPALLYQGDKKYARNVCVTFGRLPEVNLEAIGYARVESKLAQLRRHYLNDAEVIRAAELLRDRQKNDLTSVGISFRGQPKTREGTQGWCIESMALLVTNKECHATVFYRCTEVIFKFAADLVLLREMFDRIGVTPTAIDFHFAVAWVGMTFLPALFVSTPPIAFLERLRAEDRTLWMSATNNLSHYIANDPAKYGPQKRQRNFLQKSMSEDRLAALGDYLREHGRASKPDVVRDLLSERSTRHARTILYSGS